MYIYSLIYSFISIIPGSKLLWCSSSVSLPVHIQFMKIYLEISKRITERRTAKSESVSPPVHDQFMEICFHWIFLKANWLLKCSQTDSTTEIVSFIQQEWKPVQLKTTCVAVAFLNWIFGGSGTTGSTQLSKLQICFIIRTYYDIHWYLFIHSFVIDFF